MKQQCYKQEKQYNTRSLARVVCLAAQNRIKEKKPLDINSYSDGTLDRFFNMHKELLERV